MIVFLSLPVFQRNSILASQMWLGFFWFKFIVLNSWIYIYLMYQSIAVIILIDTEIVPSLPTWSRFWMSMTLVIFHSSLVFGMIDVPYTLNAIGRESTTILHFSQSPSFCFCFPLFCFKWEMVFRPQSSHWGCSLQLLIIVSRPFR